MITIGSCIHALDLIKDVGLPTARSVFLYWMQRYEPIEDEL